MVHLFILLAHPFWPRTAFIYYFSVCRWLKTRESGGGAGSSAPPKGVKLFHPAAASAVVASASVASATAASSSSGSSGEEKCEVLWPLRLMTLRGSKGAEAVQRVKSSLRHDIKWDGCIHCVCCVCIYWLAHTRVTRPFHTNLLTLSVWIRPMEDQWIKPPRQLSCLP